MRPICWPETSVNNYYYTIRKVLQSRRLHLLRGGILKSRMVFELPYKLILICETEIYTNDNDSHLSSGHYTDTTLRTMAMGIDITVGWHLFRKMLQLIRHTHTHTQRGLQNTLYTNCTNRALLLNLQFSSATLPIDKHLTNFLPHTSRKACISSYKMLIKITRSKRNTK